MNLEQFAAYALTVLAVCSAVWMLLGGLARGGDVLRRDLESGWHRLPGVFKFFWPFAEAFEDTLGRAFARVFAGTARTVAAAVPPSGLPLTVERVFATAGFMALLFGFLGIVLAASVALAFPDVKTWVPFAGATLFVPLGWFWPIQNLKAHAERRQEELTRQLPFAIDLVTAAIQSGLDFGAALRYYVTDSGVKGALLEEFGRVFRDMRINSTLPEALKAMDERVRLAAFTSFVDAVAYGAEVGAPISNVLKVFAAEMRRTRFALAEQKAARAPVLIILPLALFIMPATFIVIATPMVIQFLQSGMKFGH